ncbi:MAG: hypothetical protein QNK23_05295 [Crocinitomicaceae bacterium]|nr:hypothetical protein [Crocinitomicaceae bacterium]
MLLTYLLFLVIAITFKIMHWPGTSVIFLFAPMFLLIDILIQSIRKKGDKEIRVLSSVAALLLSIYLAYKFLHWPGNQVWLWTGLILSGVYLFRLFQKKVGYNFRFILTGILLLFAVFNATISGSSFRLLYLAEDPFNPSEPAPHYFVQRLAYDFYLEQDYEKAELLIVRNINHLDDLLEDDASVQYYRTVDLQNMEQSKKDLEDIQNRTWTIFSSLIPEDRQLDLE